MTDQPTIRESTPEDLGELDGLYGEAFPTEDVRPLVRELLGGSVDVLSLVATRDRRLVGQAIFTRCSVPGTAEPVSLLGPLAVRPDSQRRGIGTRLLNEGAERLRRAGVVKIFLMGDPAYYSRFGFKAETEVETPEPIPDKWRSAWQSLDLRDPPGGEAAAAHGAAAADRTLIVPNVWRKPEHWAPPP